MVVARQLFTRFELRSLHVMLLAAPEELKGDAAANYRMLQVCGCPVERAHPGRSAPGDHSGGRATRHWHQRSGHRRDARSHTRDQRRFSAGESGGGGYSVWHAERFRRTAGRTGARRLYGDLHGSQAGAGAAAELRCGGRVARGAPSAARRGSTMRTIPSGFRWSSRRCSGTCSRRARGPPTKAASATCW